ncbi:tyrosine-protein phosphatase, partial [Vibrio parahaemolyticus]
WHREVASHFALPPALADVLLGAHAELLDAAFDAIDREHGDLDAYAERALGLDATARRELDAALLV